MAEEPAAKRSRAAPTGLGSDHPRVVLHARYPGKDQPPKELHYFCLRVLGELPRLLLEATQTPYDSIMYFSSREYKEMAAFGQMPLYKGPELGDLTLAQSGSICRHIARETGIAGSTAAEMARQDMLFEFGKDILGFKAEIYNAEMDATFKSYMDKGEAMQNKSEGPFLSGTTLGLGDVSVFHSLQTFDELKPGFMSAWPKLDAFRKAVAALPALAAYLDSPRRIPLTPNELGTKPHSGLNPAGYAFITPLNPETYAEPLDN